MVACCDGCGFQYLTTDGTIDPPSLDKAKYDWRRWAEANTKLTQSQINARVEQLGTCRCHCHVIGSSVMH